MKFLTAAIMLVVGIGRVFPAGAQDMNWLNAHEVGTYRFIEAHFGNLYPILLKAQRAWGVTKRHREEGQNHDHFDAVNRDLCALSAQVMQKQRSNDRRRALSGNVKLISPPTLTAYSSAARALFELSRKFSHIENCRELTWNERLLFARAVQKLKKARDAVSDLTRQRAAQQYKWSNTFSVELSPLPLKLEFIEGSLKLKFTRSVGPLKFDFQTGPKATKYNGLEFFMIVGPDRNARVFDVRGQRFSFGTGLGVVEVNGAWLTYRCDWQCSAAYDELN